MVRRQSRTRIAVLAAVATVASMGCAADGSSGVDEGGDKHFIPDANYTCTVTDSEEHATLVRGGRVSSGMFGWAMNVDLGKGELVLPYVPALETEAAPRIEWHDLPSYPSFSPALLELAVSDDGYVGSLTLGEAPPVSIHCGYAGEGIPGQELPDAKDDLEELVSAIIVDGVFTELSDANPETLRCLATAKFVPDGHPAPGTCMVSSADGFYAIVLGVMEGERVYHVNRIR